jgi:hypothetical protein
MVPGSWCRSDRALFQGDLHFLAGGRWLARDLKLGLRFGGSELHARAALGSPNLGQKVPVPKMRKTSLPLTWLGDSGWNRESVVVPVLRLQSMMKFVSESALAIL